MSDASSRSASGPLRVMTYNVHRCIGWDDIYDPQRIARVLQEHQPDVVALQEIDTSLEEKNELGPLDVLARKTELWPLVSPTMEQPTGFYGNALLVRHEVCSIRRHVLSVSNYEPRTALDVVLRIGGQKVRILNTHLGLRHAERRRQIDDLLHALYEFWEHLPTVILGDFNEWLPTSANLRKLHHHLGYSPRPATYPAFSPILSLDRIWTRPATALQEVSIPFDSRARFASDHLPVFATVDF